MMDLETAENFTFDNTLIVTTTLTLTLTLITKGILIFNQLLSKMGVNFQKKSP